ncbi:MAG: PQQ-dependent sugar dehydrogenase [Balneolaceae bacterium]
MMKKRITLITLTLVLLSNCSGAFGDVSSVGNEPPEANRFTYHVVVDGLDEPFQVDFDQQGHVYWIERGGAIKRVNESTDQINELGKLSIYEGRAPGLIGFLLDKDFEQTGYIYMYYSAAEDEGDMRLSRFTLSSDGTLDMDSEIVVLVVPWEQPDSSHTGGGMAWDDEGNLHLTTGDGTTYSEYEPIHYMNEEDSTEVYDGARSAGNTNDLRGSILRITPQPDGSYTIPEGNLFVEGTPGTRPELYTMGSRNPWRLSIDSQTGYLHWAEVGPDAGVDSEEYGSRGYDELEVAREAGNHGWPFVIGQNRPYNQYDYETKTYGEPYDLQAPVNNSPNNTGLRELPPARPALVAYPYGVAENWSVLSSGSRSGVGGPVFRRADFGSDAPRVFPEYFAGKWLVTDYVRNWIMVITMNEDRTEALDIERLLPWERISHKHPLDMKFGPTGDLYLIEYGLGGQGRISRYEYNDGNRAPVARAGAESMSGAAPLELQLSSEGTVDYDADELQYDWVVHSVAGGQIQRFTEANPVVVLEQAGRYQVDLTVTDPDGAGDSASFEVVAGNERPEVNLEITRGNRSFYFPDKMIDYQVQVSDHEDGSLSDGGIVPERVSMTAEYIPSGITPSQLAELQDEGALDSGATLRHVNAKALINEYNCSICHQVNSPLIGPSFTEIAERYEEEEGVPEELSKSIIGGSTGKWGEVQMPPNFMVSEVEAGQITEYILSLALPEEELIRRPLQDSYTTEGHDLIAIDNQGDNEDRLVRYFDVPYEMGSYIFHARYTDEGNSEVEGLALPSEDLVLLRYPLLGPESADIFSKEGITFTPSIARHPGFIVSGSEPYIGFEQIDLTGIRQIDIGAQTRHYNWEHFIGATHEIRLGSPDGPLVGKHEQIPPDNSTAEIDVSEVNGIHDIYVIFRNPDAEPEDALLAVWGIEFKQ